MKTTIGSSRKKRAHSLLELLCIMGIIGLLMAMFLPTVTQGRERAKRIQCVSQLHQLGLGFHMFAHEHNSQYPMAVPREAGGSLEFVLNAARVQGDFYFSFRHFQVLSNELTTPKLLVCPADTRWAAANFGTLTNGNLSYFITITAEHGQPNSLLAGDRNLANEQGGSPTRLQLDAEHTLRWTQDLYRGCGNLLFADGRVEERNSRYLRAAAPDSPTTRLFLPSTPFVVRPPVNVPAP